MYAFIIMIKFDFSCNTYTPQMKNTKLAIMGFAWGLPIKRISKFCILGNGIVTLNDCN